MLTGIVVEVKARTCVILTPDAQFREIPLPAGGARPGEEVSFSYRRRPVYWRSLLVAASLLLILGAGLFYRGWMNQAVAYVSLDINPSVEMALDRRELVCQARGLNAAGEDLLSRVPVLGLPVEKAIGSLLDRAVQSRYLQPARNNVILTTITAESGREPAPQAGEIYRVIVKSLSSAGVPAEVVVETAAPEMRRQASRLGLSTGRYLIHVEGKKKGLNIELEELKKEKISSLEQKKGVTIKEVLGKHGYSGWVPAPGAVAPGSQVKNSRPLPGAAKDTAGSRVQERVPPSQGKASRVDHRSGAAVQEPVPPAERVTPGKGRELPVRGEEGAAGRQDSARQVEVKVKNINAGSEIEFNQPAGRDRKNYDDGPGREVFPGNGDRPRIDNPGQANQGIDHAVRVEIKKGKENPGAGGGMENPEKTNQGKGKEKGKSAGKCSRSI
ncbi:anti-sigma factor domain-containing protein [Desulfofundulus thermocisternus]|uniref:anti-sigma factor domain-containing protein n=1 Tax=Desulfofundulus thermocisternus TaxID=42471 RepID=UPI00217EB6E5|nr:anti-sigma factor domain-containing protein [Desulfofundulus thermocisternus]MCS5694511.1 anti-sigma factor domain-containing protein [Desulfofundulus thermocisternus]